MGTLFEVEPPLSDIVKHFYAFHTAADYEETTGHLSPNYEMVLLFNFGAPVNISFAAAPMENLYVERVALLGPLKKMLNYSLLKNTDIFTAVFNLDGFYRLFQIPIDQLDSEDIHYPDETIYNGLWTALKNVGDEERVQILSEYILSFTHASDQASIALLEGAAYFDNPVIEPAKAIAGDTSLSERTIQLRFKKYVGYSPKEMLRFLRFKQVITSIEQHTGNEIDWFDLIHDFGYHDQSHLIKDFNHFLGVSPQTFIKKIAGKEFCTTKPGKNY
jgi:AraC-like DNA-binding protein